MGLSFNSLNMFNTPPLGSLGNCFGTSGMFGMSNMFGNYGLGGSIFGGFGSSPFMDCNGYTNYNAMAGLALGNTLLNFAGMGINYACANAGGSRSAGESKAEALNKELDTCIKNIDKKLEKLNKSFEAKDITASDLDAEDVKTTELINAEKKLADKESDKPKSEDHKKTDGTDDTASYNAACTQYNKDISKLKEAVDDAKEAQAKLIKEIKDLIIDREQIKADINKAILDNADGSKPKHRNANLKLDDFLNPENHSTPREIKNVSKEDVTQLIHLFRKAANDNEKRDCAQAMKNIEFTAFSSVATNDLYDARNIMLDWLAKNPYPTNSQGA